MINFHKVDTVEDMEAYIARISEIGRVIDQYLVRAKAATDGGVRMPRFAYEQTLSEARRVMTFKLVTTPSTTSCSRPE